MPTLWPAGPWRFEAAVTITECNGQSVTNWLQFAQIAEYGRVSYQRPVDHLDARSSCYGRVMSGDLAAWISRPGCPVPDREFVVAPGVPSAARQQVDPYLDDLRFRRGGCHRAEPAQKAQDGGVRGKA
jgi:hypothetical protein